MADLFDNRYRFKNDLGVGGCGRVFLAEEEESKHLVGKNAIRIGNNEYEITNDKTKLL